MKSILHFILSYALFLTAINNVYPSEQKSKTESINIELKKVNEKNNVDDEIIEVTDEDENEIKLENESCKHQEEDSIKKYLRCGKCNKVKWKKLLYLSLAIVSTLIGVSISGALMYLGIYLSKKADSINPQKPEGWQWPECNQIQDSLWGSDCIYSCPEEMLLCRESAWSSDFCYPSSKGEAACDQYIDAEYAQGRWSMLAALPYTGSIISLIGGCLGCCSFGFCTCLIDE